MGSEALVACRVSHVSVVDAYEVVYAGISSWLAADGELSAAAAAHYTDIGQLLREHPIPADRAHVVLLGLNVDEPPNFNAVRELSARGHRVVVYAHLTDHDAIRSVIASGALSYLTKAEGRDHLLAAIRSAVTATPYAGPSMEAALQGHDACPRPVLAPREQEVLLAWFQTDSKDMVAQQLFLAPSTVRTHLQRIRAKYTAAGRPAGTKAALVARAIQDRIISIDDL